MMKHIDIIQLIGDLCVEEFIAGGKTDVDSVKSALAMRAHLVDAVRDLYDELEHESYEREQIQVELMKANNELANLRDQVRSYQATIRKLTHCIDFYDIPDDGDKFSEQDLPFPDVDDLTPASELLGGDE